MSDSDEDDGYAVLTDAILAQGMYSVEKLRLAEERRLSRSIAAAHSALATKLQELQEAYQQQVSHLESQTQAYVAELRAAATEAVAHRLQALSPSLAPHTAATLRTSPRSPQPRTPSHVSHQGQRPGGSPFQSGSQARGEPMQPLTHSRLSANGAAARRLASRSPTSPLTPGRRLPGQPHSSLKDPDVLPPFLRPHGVEAAMQLLSSAQPGYPGGKPADPSGVRGLGDEGRGGGSPSPGALHRRQPKVLQLLLEADSD
ncbi:hypothetical protein QJQ45_025003 [Haematococcus lacustris]|nr:hypothetical protein QJQ45_025003 [Haematococcus lacustris]